MLIGRHLTTKFSSQKIVFSKISNNIKVCVTQKKNKKSTDYYIWVHPTPQNRDRFVFSCRIFTLCSFNCFSTFRTTIVSISYLHSQLTEPSGIHMFWSQPRRINVVKFLFLKLTPVLRIRAMLNTDMYPTCEKISIRKGGRKNTLF